MNNYFKTFGASMLIFACAVLSGCATDLIGKSADLTKFEFPTGMAVHPNGKYAYVVGSNFDLDYRATDGGVLYVINLETGAIMPSSKKMGSFGTNVVLSSDARRGYTVTRDDDALVWFDISEDGSTISCPNAPDSDTLLDCRVIVDDDPTHVAITRSYRDKVTYLPDGQSVTQRTEFDLLMIGQLRNARVTAVTVRDGAEGKPEFSFQSSSYVYGASEVLWIGGEQFIVTGRSASNLLVISPALNADGGVEGLYARQGITVPNAFGAYEGRGMTLDPLGKDFFLINQYPNTLLKFDISGLVKGDNATDEAHVTQMMTLPSDMSKVAWVGDAAQGLLYLTSVIDDSIYIVDPRTMDIVKTVSTGDGPYEMTIVGDTMYVINFLEESIQAFDVSEPLEPVLESVVIANTDAIEDKDVE